VAGNLTHPTGSRGTAQSGTLCQEPALESVVLTVRLVGMWTAIWLWERVLSSALRTQETTRQLGPRREEGRLEAPPRRQGGGGRRSTGGGRPADRGMHALLGCTMSRKRGTMRVREAPCTKVQPGGGRLVPSKGGKLGRPLGAKEKGETHWGDGSRKNGKLGRKGLLVLWGASVKKRGQGMVC